MVISVTQDNLPVAEQLSGWLLCYRFSSSPKDAAGPLKLPHLPSSAVSPLTGKTHQLKHHQASLAARYNVGDGFQAGNQGASGNTPESPK